MFIKIFQEFSQRQLYKKLDSIPHVASETWLNQIFEVSYDTYILEALHRLSKSHSNFSRLFIVKHRKTKIFSNSLFFGFRYYNAFFQYTVKHLSSNQEVVEEVSRTVFIIIVKDFIFMKYHQMYHRFLYLLFLPQSLPHIK